MATLEVSNSAIKVANAALNELGIDPITSFLDNSKKARVLNTQFADVVEEALSMYPWRFARKTATLQRLAATPPETWEGVYQRPADSLAIQTVRVDGSSAEFDQNADGVLVNVTATSPSVVTADYTIYRTPDTWPGYFRRFFIFHLAAAVCMPLTQDDQLKAGLQSEAYSRMKLAQTRESQNRTPPRLNTKMFIQQRRTGGRSK